MRAAPVVGRSLRLLLVLALLLALWLALRLPVLQRDLTELRVAEVPVPVAPTARLVMAAATDAPNVAIAEAEVAVAEAALGLARARLRLAQVQAGVPVAAVPVTVAAVPAKVAAVPVSVAAMMPPPRLAPPVVSRPVRARMMVAAADVPAADAPITRPAPQLAAAPLSQPNPALPATPGGYDLATAAYARLAAGDRRMAVALFDAALATEPAPGDAALRPLWTAERRRLLRRWSGDAYTLLRDLGPAGPAASPVLGGGQSGGTLAWTLDPLARRPLALVARYNAASLGGSIDPATGQAAFGVRWRPLKGVSISAERLIATGVFARNDWTLRLAGGAEGKQGPVLWSGYGEAGALAAGDVFAGGQLRAGVPVVRLGKASLVGGAGSWASIQTGSGFTNGRVDVGPTLLLRAPLGKVAIDVAADWRFRVAGNALPGSGPAVTISTGF